MSLPAHGRTRDDVLADLDSFKANDVRWRDGHAFTLTYSAGADVIAVAEAAYAKYSTENALNTDAFPSLSTGWYASFSSGVFGRRARPLLVSPSATASLFRGIETYCGSIPGTRTETASSDALGRGDRVDRRTWNGVLLLLTARSGGRRYA